MFCFRMISLLKNLKHTSNKIFIALTGSLKEKQNGSVYNIQILTQLLPINVTLSFSLIAQAEQTLHSKS